jgi:PTH1 family peptidyl-tRNA hydrolase
MRLFVGLGNPGARYAGNRHNIGFMAVSRLAEVHRASPWRSKFQGEMAEVRFGSDKLILLRPTTYMNESGRSVQEAARFFQLGLDRITVFHDELDLAFGRVRVKVGGGHAGNNGIRSIAGHMGPDFQRVRLGIGHPGHKDLVSRYVLSDFSKVERAFVDDLVDAVAGAAPKLAAGDAPGFLNEVALKCPAPKPEKKPE